MPYTTLQDRLSSLPFGDTPIILKGTRERRALVQRHPQSRHPRVTLARELYLVTYRVQGDMVHVETVRNGAEFHEDHAARCSAPAAVIEYFPQRTPL